MLWLLFFASFPADATVEAARDRLAADVRYDGAYHSLTYPGGDVPADTGVCTDVVIRALRAAHGYDLQKEVHEDMRANFGAYPANWGLSRPDRNIDHRRVPNLETFFTRQEWSVPVSDDPDNYLPGDIVSWRLGGNLPHIGIITGRGPDGTVLAVHNIGGGPVEDDILFRVRIVGHFRLPAESSRSRHIRHTRDTAAR